MRDRGRLTRPELSWVLCHLRANTTRHRQAGRQDHAAVEAARAATVERFIHHPHTTS